MKKNVERSKSAYLNGFLVKYRLETSIFLRFAQNPF